MAFGLGACAHAQQPATTNAAAKACAEWRWIGIKSQPGDACPAIAGWKAEPLFEALAAERVKADPYGREKGLPTAVPSGKVVQELKRFCVYDRKSDGASPPAASGRLVRIDRDCAAIAVAADEDQVTDWRQYSKRFLQQAGKPGEPLAIKNREGVRLAFLDTHPTGEGVPTQRPTAKGSSEHGYTMAHIARNLICSPEESRVCAALITTRLALPITSFDPKSEKRTTRAVKGQGGRIGLQSDLADAIRDEVDDWVLDGKPQRLVLNLSVAWDGDLFSGLDEQQVAQMRAGTQAVYWALRYATGFDALVVAAAGNKSTCAKSGPLLPAAWEKGGPLNELSAGSPTTPLLYAVGAVDSMGEPLANSRDKATPMRVAYGSSTVVSAPAAGQKSTAKHTGTSVATAVVSSVAAIVWDTLPDRSPARIMEILYRSGDPLPYQDRKSALPPRQADFWFGAGAANIQGGAPQVRRISLCPALQAACKELGDQGACPMPKVSCVWTPVPNLPSSPAPLSSCDPWVHPQPIFEPCPVCEPPRG
jgi:hypothetical protein